MGPTDTFRSQHAELLEIVGDISALLSEETVAQKAKDISRLLAQFNGKLKGHLAMEDRVLYPKLLAHSDPHINNMASRFMTEMGGIADVVAQYSGQWSSANAIEADARTFITQTKRLFSALDKRIKSEDSVLYPALEKISQ